MRLLTIALLLATLAVTLIHAVALPGGGGGKGVPRCKNETVIVPNEAARWHCTHKYKVMFSHYTLRGSDWNKSEEEIKLAVNAAAFVTKWRYNEEPNDHGGMDFESSVSQRRDVMRRFWLRLACLLSSLWFKCCEKQEAWLTFSFFAQ